MKLIYTLSLCLSVVFLCQAQSAMFEDNYKETVQNIGQLEVKLTYNAINSEDQVVLGNSIPFGEIWKDDSKAPTNIIFNKSVIIGNQPLAAGSYSVFIIPADGVWTFIIQDATVYNSAGKYMKTNDLFRMGIITKPVEEFQSTYSIVCSDIQASNFKLNHTWGNTSVSLPVKTVL